MGEEIDLPVWAIVLLFVVLVPLLLAQGSWLFIDARKRGAYPWFWGIWGLFHFPLPLIFYWLIVRMDILRRSSRSKKGRSKKTSKK